MSPSLPGYINPAINHLEHGYSQNLHYGSTLPKSPTHNYEDHNLKKFRAVIEKTLEN